MKTIFAPSNRKGLIQYKYLSFIKIEFFVFAVEAFQFSKFDATKPNVTNTSLNKV